MNFWRRRSDIERIAELMAERDGLAADIRGKDVVIGEKDARIAALDATVAERDESVKELTAERDGLVAEKNALTAERDGLAADIRGKDVVIGEKDARIAALDATVAKRDGSVKELIAEQGRLTAARDGLAAEKSRLESVIGEKDSQIAAQAEAMAARDARVAELTAERDGLVAERNGLAAALEKERNFCVCNVCGNKSEFKFGGRILNKYDIRYYLCPTCGHVQTEKPYWLGEAYGSAISVSDTGVVLRNEHACDVVKAVVATFFDSSAKVLEYAGGYGLLTRMLRDAGVDCRWYDKYAKPVFAIGFEDDGKCKYDVVTAFEALEHFEEPLGELKKIFARAHTLIFSEELLPDPVPAPADWWYYCLEHGQHINLYSRKTLELLAARFGKRLVYHGSIGMMTDRDIDEEAFAKCVEDCRAIAAARKWPTLSVSDMNLMIDAMAEEK